MPLLPAELKSLVSGSAYFALCESFRERSRYAVWEMLVGTTLCVLPPLARQFYLSRRAVRARRLQELIASHHNLG